MEVEIQEEEEIRERRIQPYKQTGVYAISWTQYPLMVPHGKRPTEYRVSLFLCVYTVQIYTRQRNNNPVVCESASAIKSVGLFLYIIDHPHPISIVWSRTNIKSPKILHPPLSF